jgi:hypothetical protein
MKLKTAKKIAIQAMKDQRKYHAVSFHAVNLGYTKNRAMKKAHDRYIKLTEAIERLEKKELFD